MTKQRRVIHTLKVDRTPGHLYFIDKDGDLAKRKSNPGHVIGNPNGYKNKKVVRLGIKKQKGFMYYYKPRKNQPELVDIIELRMKNG